MIVLATRRKVFFDDDYQQLQTPNSKGKVRKVNSKSLAELMQADESQQEFVDFIDRCIEWKPDKRMTPLEAFDHPWIQSGLQELRPQIAASKPSTADAGEQEQLPTLNR
jgi:serine/threonine protein kinase